AGIAVGSAAIQVVKHVACRARPRLVDGWGVDTVGPPGVPVPPPSGGALFNWPCFAGTRYHSFPSGPATAAFAVAAALRPAVPGLRRVWLAVAGSVALSRVLLNAHFLSDVLGGAALGWLAGQLGVQLVLRLAPIPEVGEPVAVGVEPERGAGAPSR